MKCGCRAEYICLISRLKINFQQSNVTNFTEIVQMAKSIHFYDFNNKPVSRRYYISAGFKDLYCCLFFFGPTEHYTDREELWRKKYGWNHEHSALKREVGYGY